MRESVVGKQVVSEDGLITDETLPSDDKGYIEVLPEFMRPDGSSHLSSLIQDQAGAILEEIFRPGNNIEIIMEHSEDYS